MNQKSYKELRFSDDFMFCKIMMENKDICKEVIELLIGCKVKDIVYLENQKTIDITSDGKGIRLDVYLEDGNTVYDIEMQTTLSKDLPKRARYYQGMIDLNLINRGAAYSELKKSYVVFICLDDFAKKNRSIYTFRNCCIEDKNIELDDDSTKVFVNANGNREGLTEAQIAFLDYISGKEPSDSFTRRLNREIQKALDKEEWEVEYMTLLQRDKVKYEEGRVEGKVEGRTQELISLVRDGLLLPEIAAERLNITVDKFFELMKEKENK
ncbi:MAG: Rpn family recombination-promoting nuclease/putative transposase [Pseudobutyrivibrio ruminis]|nr:Rpn family recombination-promoting nuclease/putative transposase [Pseudobutyrivibrio ruminis]